MAGCRSPVWTAWTPEFWYSYSAHPGYRAYRHNQFDRYIIEEVVPFIHVSHAATLMWRPWDAALARPPPAGTFRHPDQISKVQMLHVVFDITDIIIGYYDDNVYFNNPKDYLPRAQRSLYAGSSPTHKNHQLTSPQQTVFTPRPPLRVQRAAGEGVRFLWTFQ